MQKRGGGIRLQMFSFFFIHSFSFNSLYLNRLFYQISEIKNKKKYKFAFSWKVNF